MKINLTKMLMIAGALFATSTAKSQTSFSHSIGPGLYIAGDKGAGFGGVYSPRLNFMELSDEMTLSIGTHLGFGFSGSSNSQSGESSSTFLLDAPLMAEINMGHASYPDASSSFGGFAGVGFGYNRMAASYTDDLGLPVSGSLSSAGFVINGGIRALIKDRSFGLRAAYMFNMKSGGANVLGLTLSYNLN